MPEDEAASNAEMNMRGRFTPLVAVVSRRRWKMVVVLRQNGADANKVGRSLGRIMQSATPEITKTHEQHRDFLKAKP